MVSIARRYQRYGIPLAELISEGNFGVVRALNKFDGTRGTLFITYASYWVRACILQHVLRSWSIVGSGTAALPLVLQTAPRAREARGLDR